MSGPGTKNIDSLQQLKSSLPWLGLVYLSSFVPFVNMDCHFSWSRSLELVSFAASRSRVIVLWSENASIVILNNKSALLCLARQSGVLNMKHSGVFQ